MLKKIFLLLLSASLSLVFISCEPGGQNPVVPEPPPYQPNAPTKTLVHGTWKNIAAETQLAYLIYDSTIQRLDYKGNSGMNYRFEGWTTYDASVKRGSFFWIGFSNNYDTLYQGFDSAFTNPFRFVRDTSHADLSTWIEKVIIADSLSYPGIADNTTGYGVQSLTYDDSSGYALIGGGFGEGGVTEFHTDGTIVDISGGWGVNSFCAFRGALWLGKSSFLEKMVAQSGSLIASYNLSSYGVTAMSSIAVTDSAIIVLASRTMLFFDDGGHFLRQLHIIAGLGRLCSIGHKLYGATAGSSVLFEIDPQTGRALQTYQLLFNGVNFRVDALAMRDGHLVFADFTNHYLRVFSTPF